ncbi:MAG: virulence RhuM family protein [Candidatus Cloacimonetes bacterium]|nr:virulence RhuM family protein [Candidatus Cloacimonadota bacterium]MCB5288186.1 virulence RhuM family protein [Candidatus Cloacimonadota bacterium]MCK9185704.1 virulence RhuM family protein [Candidatus Cloacimonadota bacterium]MDY0230514.1 virulence RhuM family protein [Candidatus Cloacimonadaceae bacterium]
MTNKELSGKSEILLYQGTDGKLRLETRLENESVWLSLKELAELFGIDQSGISRHLKNIFTSGELTRDSVVAFFAITANDGKTYNVEHFNLDAIISVGYRVNSIIGTHFRKWATGRLREYIIKGFTMDDERLKETGGGKYFEELLARIRDIRSSEKVFWRKVLDIYATSMDYDPRAEVSRDFFRVLQNKMHWASHGHTAAEIVYQRADSSKANMGLTNWSGSLPRKADIGVAKNYLDETELNILNRIVTLYLDFAELQALERKAMYMKDWIIKLDDFLRLSGRDILEHADKIAHEDALQKARTEYEEWHQEQLSQPTEVEKHFVEVVQEVKRLEKRDKKDR